MNEPSRCLWATTPAMIAYHDREWGVPVRDDKKLFEFLTLEGAQAGLSWETILNKRAHYRECFSRFDFNKVAKFTQHDVKRLLGDHRIVRNKLKIEATINNARAVLALRESTRSTFSSYLWDFVGGAPIVNRPRRIGDVPATTPLFLELSKDLKSRGFRFVGPTIVYAFMQAVGLVDDHLATCFRANELTAAGRGR